MTPVVSSDPVATSTHHIRRVPDDLWRRISVAAVSRGMTRSAIVIEALAEWLKRTERDEAFPGK